MKLSICAATAAMLLLVGNPVLAQDEVQLAEDQERAQRIARIKELRELQMEERQARRRHIRERLQGLSEDEKQALRERRRLLDLARMRQGQRRHGSTNRSCPCPDSADHGNSESQQP